MVKGDTKSFRRKKRRSFAKWPKRRTVGAVRGCMPMMTWRLSRQREDKYGYMKCIVELFGDDRNGRKMDAHPVMI